MRRTTARPPRRAAGFTMLEILVAMVILATLVALVAGAGYAFGRMGKQKSTQATLAVLDSIVNEYHAETGKYPGGASPVPGDMTDLINEVKGVGRIENMLGSLNKSYIAGGSPQVLDAWGQPLVLQNAGTATTRPTFYSRGPDQADDGGGGDDLLSAGGAG